MRTRLWGKALSYALDNCQVLTRSTQHAYLDDVFRRLPAHPHSGIDDFLPDR